MGPKPKPPAPCSEPTCERNAIARNLCTLHYARRRRAGIDQPECAVEGCARPAVTRGWCDRHYQRHLAHGSPTSGQPDRVIGDDRLRYERNIDRSGGPGACHEWKGHRTEDGYGRLWVGDGLILAHRFGYELHIGPIPDGLLVCHTCDNPPCQNRRHWFLGSDQDNTDDKMRKGRRPRTTGERNPRARLTPADVIAIRRRYDNRETAALIAADFGITSTHVHMVGKRRAWQHLEEVC